MKTREETLTFINHIATDIKNAGGRVFYVGGCVRDELLGRKSNDLDVEVYGIKANVLNEILSKYGTQEIVGNKFGIFNVHGYDVDISLPRKDNKVGLKHQDFDVVVDPFMSFEEATARRDFTINAIMKDVLTGEIVDVNNGIRDLNNKEIKHVNDEHFAEDPLRVLRAARFAAQLDFSIDERTKKICSVIDLKDLSAERILTETKKALMSNCPSKFFESLKEINQLETWFPELKALVGLKQNPNYHLEDAFEHTMMVTDASVEIRKNAKNPEGLTFACLCHDFGKATKTDSLTFKAVDHEIDSEILAERFLKRLKTDTATINYVKNLSKMHMQPGQLYNSRSHNKKIIAILDATPYPEDLLLIKECDRLGAIPGPKWTERTDFPYKDWSKKALDDYNKWLTQPHLKGEDLINVGIPESKQMGEILLRARQLEYSNSFTDALTQLSKQYKMTSEQVSKILSAKGIKNETREAKILAKYQKFGYCKEIKNPRDVKDVVLAADKELTDEFTKTKRPACEYMEFLKEKLGDNAERHQRIVNNIEKNKNFENRTY